MSIPFKNLHIGSADWNFEHKNENEIALFNAKLAEITAEYNELLNVYNNLSDRLDVLTEGKDLTQFIDKIKNEINNSTTAEPTTLSPTTIDATTESPATTEAPTSEVPVTTVAPVTTEAPEYEYWNTNVSELSGMTFLGDTLYGVSDKGILYSIELGENHESTSTRVATIDGKPDLEGLTTDGTMLYVCAEGTQQIIKIDPSNNFASEILGNVYDYMKAVADAEADTYDPNGNGIEAIAYYKDGIVLVGNQDKAAAIGAFNVNTKTVVGSADHIGSSKYDIGEIADIAIDGENVYVLDSESGRVIKTTMKVTKNGNYKIENYEGVNIASGLGHEGVDRMTLKFISTAKIENPEALCINGNYLYYGCDGSDGGRIYRINKF